MTPTIQQVEAQFKSLRDPEDPCKAAKLAYYAVTIAQAEIQVSIDAMTRKQAVLMSKMNRPSLMTRQDYLDMADIEENLAPAVAKRDQLMNDAIAKHLAFVALQGQIEKAAKALLDDPGAVENTGGTPVA